MSFEEFIDTVDAYLYGEYGLTHEELDCDWLAAWNAMRDPEDVAEEAYLDDGE